MNRARRAVCWHEARRRAGIANRWAFRTVCRLPIGSGFHPSGPGLPDIDALAWEIAERMAREEPAPIVFLAALPPIQSAIKVGADGARIQFDVPKSDLDAVKQLMDCDGKILSVAVVVADEPHGSEQPHGSD